MVYGQISEVRRLAGNPPDTGTGAYTDADITNLISYADRLTDAKTGIVNWPSTDVNYPLVQRLSNLLAAEALLENDPGRKDLESKLEIEADKLAGIIASDVQGSSGKFIIEVSDYATQPLNPQVLPFTSQNGPRRTQFLSVSRNLGMGLLD